MYIRVASIIFCLCFTVKFSAAQSISAADTLRLIELKEQGLSYNDEGDYTRGIETFQRLISLSDSMIAQNVCPAFAKVKRIDGYRYLGLSIEHTDSFEVAPSYLLKALNYAIQENRFDRQGSILGHLGMYYYNSGDYPTSLKYSMRELEVGKSRGDKYRMASAYNRIGINYKRQMMHPVALENLFNSANLYLENEDSSEAANAWNNIGNVYFNMKSYKEAYEFYKKEYDFGLLLHDGELVADAYNCIAQIFNETAFYPTDSLIHYFNYSKDQISAMPSGFLLDSAIHYFTQSAAYYSDKKQVYETSDCFIGLGTTYGLKRNYSAAISAYSRAYELAKFEGILQKEMTASQGLYMNYKSIRQFDSSLYWFEVYTLVQDSIYSDSKSREIGKLESKHEFEAKEAEMLADKKKDDAVAETEKAKQQLIILIVSIGLILVLILLLFLFNRFRLIKKQKHTIEFHKLEIESKQKEIVDSITYAQRLQQAILAPEKDIVSYFPRSFLLYKPKDIVAGDFYFFEKTETHIFYAAADCTGHGVPGAMVSIVCSNALTRAVKEFRLTDPADVLNKTRELVVETFEKSGQDVKDGMDISFITKNLKTEEIFWAGAHNALWIFGQSGFKEIKPDKQPIGKSFLNNSFHSHRIPNEKGASIYLLTDGYADQFGGENLPDGKEGGKKFKASRLKELLLRVQSKSMEEQKEILHTTFENWRGNLEQLDDVCIIGIGL
ncbi:MAG: SpoIIE family protein phosphatase [Crocinitomicaceae bacterium]|nr:SpoIIE family protein phosphatase [Crocinitomicaceae bacterium]